METVGKPAALVLVVFTFAVLNSQPVWASMEADALPGWMGETHKVPDRLLRGSPEVDRITQISWKPRAFLYKNFLSDAECNHIIGIARPKLERSQVSDLKTGNGTTSEIRTSHGMFIVIKDPVIKSVEERIARWTFLPIENQEAMQVLRYRFGQKYEAHYDDYHDDQNPMQGGHRIATVLMYLSNVQKGGETVFPNVEDTVTNKNDGTWSDCGKRGIAVKPKKGDALLFWSLTPGATPDFYSLHSGCPVIEGEKWSATKWIHINSFEPPKRDPSICVDDDKRCKDWASAGECEKNPTYMVGDDVYSGSCRLSCGVCTPKT